MARTRCEQTDRQTDGQTDTVIPISPPPNFVCGGNNYLYFARVGLGSARYRPLAAHSIGCPAAGQNLEAGQLSRH